MWIKVKISAAIADSLCVDLKPRSWTKELVSWMLNQLDQSENDPAIVFTWCAREWHKNWWVSQSNFLLVWSKKDDTENWIFSGLSSIGPSLSLFSFFHRFLLPFSLRLNFSISLHLILHHSLRSIHFSLLWIHSLYSSLQISFPPEFLSLTILQLSFNNFSHHPSFWFLN